MKNILLNSDSPTLFKEITGGKCTSMQAMSKLGANVPSFVAITNYAMQAFIKENNLQSKIDLHVQSENFALIEQVFCEAKLNEDFKQEVIQVLTSQNLLGLNLAIRSSGLDEDGTKHSFAGLFSSFLFQEEEEDIFLSLKKCWASAYSERAISYRKIHNLHLQNIEMGVLIQKMIFSECAGVIFTQNPIDPIDKSKLIIDSVFGQGEGLVSGALDSDSFIIDKESFKINSKIVIKDEQFIKANNFAGIERVTIAKEKQETASLSQEQLIELTKSSIEIEEKTQTPMDIEWAIAQDEIYFLQMRPITTLPPKSYYDKQINGANAVLWDNSNIVESFNGVTTPLTFSATRQSYAIVYKQTMKVLGVPNSITSDFEYEFDHMLGMVRGRVYYNLINWYKLLLLIPGMGTNKGFMETMMGVKEDLDDKQQHLFNFMDKVPQFSIVQKIRVAKKLFMDFLNIDKIVDDFLETFEKYYQNAMDRDFNKMSLPQLADSYSDFEKNVTREWKPPIINDILVMIFFGIHKKLTEKWIHNEGDATTEHLHNDLLCGQGDLESTKPTKFLMKLAQKIDEGDATIKKEFQATDCDLLWDKVKTDPKFNEIYNAMSEFIQKYGFRCSNEQKIEDNDLTDDPSFAFNSIQSYINTNSYSIKKMNEREEKILNQARGIVAEKLTGIKKIIYNWVTKHTRNAVKNRENLRFARTKSFGLNRRRFRAIGEKFAQLEIIEDKKDIFYLHIDEILDSIRGTCTTLNFIDIVTSRKKEYQIYKDTPAPPDRFITYGSAIVSFKDTLLLSSGDLLKGKIPVSDDPNLIYGISCCPGVIEKEVRVAHTIADTKNMNGEILVTYRTDPGWVPIYPSCGGLIIERGSLLSHSAVVARELGLPTIVGVHGDIFTKIKTGDTIVLNATKGEIRLNL